MVYAIRKNKETTASLVRRFTRTAQQSGVLLEARKNRFYGKKKNKYARKVSALRRLASRKERERLMKLGRLKVEPSRRPGMKPRDDH